MVRRHVDLNVLGIETEYRKQYDALVESGFHLNPDRLNALNWELFKRLGLTRAVDAVLSRYETLPSEIRVGPADRLEGAFLSNDRQGLMIRLYPERFEDQKGLQGFLGFEMGHIRDMLDPSFGCPAAVPTLEPIVGDRVALLWGIAIDARAERDGHSPYRAAETWGQMFNNHWAQIDPEVRLKAFERFRAAKFHRHPDLMEMAREPRKLVERFGGVRTEGPVDGGRCPLCEFPTFEWVMPNGRLNARLSRRIQEDFPKWEQTRGACERCVELYESKVN